MTTETASVRPMLKDALTAKKRDTYSWTPDGADRLLDDYEAEVRAKGITAPDRVPLTLDTEPESGSTVIVHYSGHSDIYVRPDHSEFWWLPGWYDGESWATILAQVAERSGHGPFLLAAAAPELLAEVENLRAEAAQSRQGIDHYVGALEASNAEVERLRAELASATGLGERMTLLWDKACGERDEARADRDRARGIAVALEQQLAAVKNTVEVRADTARMFARLSEKGHSDSTYLVNLGKAATAADIRDEVLRVLGEQDGGDGDV